MFRHDMQAVLYCIKVMTKMYSLFYLPISFFNSDVNTEILKDSFNGRTLVQYALKG